MNSPYTLAGPSLVAMGYSAIPIFPGAKYPGNHSGGQWYRALDWNQYCDRLPTRYETPIWATRWPDAGVCIALDQQIKVIDIDTDDPDIQAAILAVIPDSPVKKRGRTGFSAFYRGSSAIVSRPFNIIPSAGAKATRVLDLLAHGRQTVLPPTIHPDTGRAYVWLDDPLDNYAPEDLPELPDDIATTLAAVLEPFGYIEDPVLHNFVGVESGDSIWREIKDSALANFDAWVPGLDIGAKRQRNGTYRAPATWRGGDGLNVSFHPDGIRDMREDVGLSPIDVVMKAYRLDDRDALEWLKVRLGYVEPWLPEIDVSALIRNGLAKGGAGAPPQGQEVSHEQFVEHALGGIVEQLSNDEPDDDGVFHDAPVAVADEDPSTDGLPPHLTSVPGLVGEVANWLTATARNPSPTLNLGAALAYVGALAGRRYAGPTDLRTNVYVIGLAKSGFGKDHPRQAIKSLAAASNTLNKFFGGEAIASSSALRNRVKKSPAILYCIDEFGGFVRKITHVRAGNHEKEIADDLLKFTGSANSIFMGADYAANLAEPIHNPNVCIFGTSAPETFWAGLGSANISDGFLPRFIVLDAGSVRVKPRDAKMSTSRPPQSLIDRVQQFVVHKSGGNLNGMTTDGTTAATPIYATWGEGAKRTYDAFVDLMFRTMDAGQVEFEPIYARVAENAMRLALIVAAGVDASEPVITAEVMQWAEDVALQSARMLIAQADERVADNERQAEYKKIRTIVWNAKKAGVTRNDVARRLKGVMDKKRMDSVLDQLVEAGDAVQQRVIGVGRPTERLWKPGCEVVVTTEGEAA